MITILIALIALLLVVTPAQAAQTGALKETFKDVNQTGVLAKGKWAEWPGDLCTWKAYGSIRRKANDTIQGRHQGTWISNGNETYDPGLIQTKEPFDGGIKSIRFLWKQWAEELGATMRLNFYLDDQLVDSIVYVVQTADGSTTNEHFTYNSKFTCDHNAQLTIKNESYATATREYIKNCRIVFDTMFITPYLRYSTKSVTLDASKSLTYTNTDLVDNTLGDGIISYTVSDPNIASINANSGEVTALKNGTVTVTAAWKNITTTYTLSIKSVPGETDYITGTVTDQNGQPISGVGVTNGLVIVETDAQGKYAIEYDELADFLFPIVPGGFDIPLDESGTPHIYANIKDVARDTVIDFTLNRQADGGAADMNHVLIAIADPQVLDKYNIWRYTNETIKDIDELRKEYPEGTKFYAIIAGDIVWDYYSAMGNMKSLSESISIPTFFCIGNHDHDCSYKCVSGKESPIQDQYADHYFKEVFGPTYYSFNIGATHYVTIDNIRYTGCGGQKSYDYVITENQMIWLEQDLARLPEGTPIVLFAHSPMTKFGDQTTQIAKWMDKGDVLQHFITGHSHTNYSNLYNGGKVVDHTLGAAKGAFWCSDWCADGSPNGYAVYEADGKNGFKEWWWKATGFPKDYQFAAYPVNSVAAKNGPVNKIIVNVWFADANWKVFVEENGSRTQLQKFTGYDPNAYDVMHENGDTRPNYPGSDGGTIASKNPGATQTSHIYSYAPKDPNADFVVEVIDRFNNVYRRKLDRNMMVATFAKDSLTNEWSYKQDFNSLFSYPNHITGNLSKGTFVQGHYPEGWYASTSGPGSNYGTFNYYNITDGSSPYPGLSNFGKSGSSAALNSSDRAMGSLPGSVQKSIAFGVLLENNTEMNIKSLYIEYTGEVWRVGTSTDPHTLTCDYLVNPDAKALRDRTVWLGQLDMNRFSPLDFTTPSSLQVAGLKSAVDGNNANNRTDVRASMNINLAPGETILFRWTNDYDGGNEQGLAIDDLVIRASSETTDLRNSSHGEEFSSPTKFIRDGQLFIIKGGKTYNALGIEVK